MIFFGGIFFSLFVLSFKHRVSWGTAATELKGMSQLKDTYSICAVTQIDLNVGPLAEGWSALPLTPLVTWQLSLCEGPTTDTFTWFTQFQNWGTKCGIWQLWHAISPCDNWLWTVFWVACRGSCRPSWPPAMWIMGATEKNLMDSVCTPCL